MVGVLYGLRLDRHRRRSLSQLCLQQSPEQYFVGLHPKNLRIAVHETALDAGDRRDFASTSLRRSEAGESVTRPSAYSKNQVTVRTKIARFDSFELDCGRTLESVEVAYETYGELNAVKSNAILVLHAFSGDAHAAGISEETGKPGWWESMIGPGKAFDTNHYFVISSNVLGGCSGTTGPASTDPRTGRPYGPKFPQVSIRDIVRLQKKLTESIGIEKLLSVAGGSMGGMQALEWAVCYPEYVASAMPIATTHRHSAQQIAFNEVGRQAIMADPDFNHGEYYGSKHPERGLAVARMVGHITYMSDDSMHEKFGRRRRISADEDSMFEVESYLRYRGEQFVTRFDANSYIVITRAMDTFDLADGGGTLGSCFDGCKTRFLVLSFTSDWLYPSYQSQEIVRALRSRNLDVAYVELESNYGHDAFLIEAGEQTALIRGFLANTFQRL